MLAFVHDYEVRLRSFTNVYRIMLRIFVAIGIIATAAAACSHPSSLGNRQREASVATDSNFVSSDELWEDVRQGHTDLYDALKSTRPGILRSGDEGLRVVVDHPFGFGDCCDRIIDLRRISTAQVKWIRRYEPGMAPPRLDYYAGVLLVTMR